MSWTVDANDGGATAWDDIGASDAASTISLAGNDHTFTNVDDFTWLSTTTSKPKLILESDNVGATGPVIKLFHDTGSPADDDDAGVIEFWNDDLANNATKFAYVLGEAEDVTDAAESGSLDFRALFNSVDSSFLLLDGYIGTEGQGAIVFNEDAKDLDIRLEGGTEPNFFYIDAGSQWLRVGDWDTNYTSFSVTGAIDQAGSATANFLTLTEGGNAVWNATETDILDSLHYIADSIDNEHINWADIDYLTNEGAAVDEAYASGWNADVGPPEKDDIYDYLHNFDADDDGSFTDETWYTALLALAGGTMTGDIQLGETDIKLDATLSGDATWSGIVIAGVSGVTTLAVGDLCYLNADDSRWELVDANLSDGYDKQLGICVLAAADGSATEMLVYGKIRSATLPALTVGSPVYMSETAGDITHTAPTTTDAAVRIMGFSITAEDLFFNPSNDYYTHT